MTRQKPLRHDGRDYLTTAQVARRLGVKEQTIYAYVSRGVLVSTRIEGIVGSLFAADEIEKLADRDGARRAPGGAVERIRTQITLQDNGVLYYRGVSAAELATVDFERVAQFLWTADLPEHAHFRSDAAVVARAARASESLPENARLVDRLRMSVDVAGVCDPLRFDTEAQSIARSAPVLIASVVDGLVGGSGTIIPKLTVSPKATVAERLWSALTPHAPDPHGIATLNSALVLLADHDLAASTLAVRMAASTRANLYATIAAGLGVMDGPYHGAATSRAYRFLDAAVEDPLGALGVRLRDGERIPGFGHVIYSNEDPRAEFLLARMRDRSDPRATRIVAAAQQIIDHMAERRDLLPNSDFALAVVAHGLGLRPDAPEAIFAIARMAGWVAHALEEYQEEGLRFRVPGVYTGVRPHR
ncbi:citrate synthase [Antrihabitans cavernicola]|uniref:citrate synthase (unknown stereospecificity) n=1 Tax=Antrihabitans cavernicola TaxID=2495913 RepID=A0A5A7S897_9NOCA|nr:citrate/2-methylcitrate synthase [Spelaeibacter cavernicola]KAA0021429.1 helix-turn-helix domain-containing protein [Spelaeibacter cavernicola]